MVIKLLLGFSVVFNTLCVVVSFYLIRITERKLPWILVSIGLVIVSLRRILMLMNSFLGIPFLSSPYLTPAAAAAMSIFLFAGLLFVIPLIQYIKDSGARYHTIFDESGVSLWEEEHYRLHMELENLKKKGVDDIRAYIDSNPGYLEELMDLITVIDVNPATLKLFKAESFEHLMENFDATFTDNSWLVFKDLIVSMYSGELVFEAETQYRNLEGKILYVILKVVNPLEKRYGKNTIVSLSDITGRSLVEFRLLSVLEEKNVLLREVYHRTKNNMQVITAMLNLRASSIEDPSMIQVFDDLTNRIHAMSLVHEKLYKAENLNRIMLDEYIDELLSLIIQTESDFDPEVDISLDLQPVWVGIDTAVPCGLIFTELVTNAFRHAFDHRDGEKIIIRLHMEKDSSEIFLSVEDNGKGFIGDYKSMEFDTLGLQTTVALGRDQLNGSITLRSRPEFDGTSWIIAFKNKAVAPRIQR